MDRPLDHRRGVLGITPGDDWQTLSGMAPHGGRASHRRRVEPMGAVRRDCAAAQSSPLVSGWHGRRPVARRRERMRPKRSGLDALDRLSLRMEITSSWVAVRIQAFAAIAARMGSARARATSATGTSCSGSVTLSVLRSSDEAGRPRQGAAQASARRRPRLRQGSKLRRARTPGGALLARRGSGAEARGDRRAHPGLLVPSRARWTSTPT